MGVVGKLSQFCRKNFQLFVDKKKSEERKHSIFYNFSALSSLTRLRSTRIVCKRCQISVNQFSLKYKTKKSKMKLHSVQIPDWWFQIAVRRQKRAFFISASHFILRQQAPKSSQVSSTSLFCFVLFNAAVFPSLSLLSSFTNFPHFHFHGKNDFHSSNWVFQVSMMPPCP